MDKVIYIKLSSKTIYSAEYKGIKIINLNYDPCTSKKF
jgi:hypothetical protein